jgi:hypothetical protein
MIIFKITDIIDRDVILFTNEVEFDEFINYFVCKGNSIKVFFAEEFYDYISKFIEYIKYYGNLDIEIYVNKEIEIDDKYLIFKDLKINNEEVKASGIDLLKKSLYDSFLKKLL